MKRWQISLVIIFSCTVFAGTFIHKGHDWGDDFAMYLMHAENIASGKDYGETGFIFNEDAPMYAPQDYAPGFPLLLVPAVSLFGQDLYYIRIYLLLFYGLFLFLIYLLLKDKVANITLYAILILLGCSAFIVLQANNILSDIPGAVFFLFTLWLIERALSSKKPAYLQWIIIGLTAAFACSVRSTTIVIIPALIIFVISAQRTKWKQLVWMLASFLTCSISLNALFHVRSNYTNMLLLHYDHKPFAEIAQQLWTMLLDYTDAYEDLFIGNMHGIATNTIVFNCLFLLFVAGLVKRLISGPTYLEWIVIGYWALVVIWPGYQGLRYFISLLPVYLLYAFGFLEQFTGKKIYTITLSVIFLLAAISIASGLVNAKDTSADYGITSASAISLFTYIQSEVPEDAIIMSAKPRAVSYKTERRGIVFPDSADEKSLKKSLDKYQIQYILLNAYPGYPAYGESLIKQDTISYREIFKNEHWQLFSYAGN